MIKTISLERFVVRTTTKKLMAAMNAPPPPPVSRAGRTRMWTRTWSFVQVLRASHIIVHWRLPAFHMVATSSQSPASTNGSFASSSVRVGQATGSVDFISGWGPLHTRAKSRDRVIVGAQKKSVHRLSQDTFKLMLVWSRDLKRSVKSYVTGSSTTCYFNEFMFIWVLTHDNIQ